MKKNYTLLCLLILFVFSNIIWFYMYENLSEKMDLQLNLEAKIISNLTSDMSKVIILQNRGMTKHDTYRFLKEEYGSNGLAIEGDIIYFHSLALRFENDTLIMIE